jgi:hypothetical protein
MGQIAALRARIAYLEAKLWPAPEDAREVERSAVRILRAVVERATDLLVVGDANLIHRRGIRAKPVSDDAPKSAVFLHGALQKPQRRRLVPLRGDHRFQDLAFMIDGAPEIAELGVGVDLHERLIQVPTPLRILAHDRHPLPRISAANIGPNRFDQNRTVMADVDPTLG